MFELDPLHTHVGTSDHSNERDFDPDDRISSESELDNETRALLYSLCPDDFPASYKPMVDDGQLAQLIHRMPENDESFLDLLRDAGPSPVKSVSGTNDWGDLNFNFLDKADFGLNSDSTDYGASGTLPDIFNTQMISNPTNTPCRDLDLDSSGPPCTEATSLDVVDDPLIVSQPNPITSKQPLVATKNTASPRKRNSKGKFECTARGCAKFVLATKCKSQMCKRHCVANGGCRDHGSQNNNLNDSSESPQSLENSAPVPQAVGDNHWALSRPSPAIPLQSITSPATNYTISSTQTGHKATNPEKMFRTEMSPAHEASWRQKKQAQLEALESKSLKAEYERRYQNQVVVIFWDKVRSPIKIVSSTQILTSMHIISRMAEIQPYTVISQSLHGQCTTWPYHLTCSMR